MAKLAPRAVLQRSIASRSCRPLLKLMFIPFNIPKSFALDSLFRVPGLEGTWPFSVLKKLFAELQDIAKVQLALLI